MALAISEVRGIVERACARQDVLDACARRDLGTVITVLKSLGVAQGQIAELTGISQGRLSEWATGKRKPRATSTFEAFADGLGIPPAARQALGLAPGASANSGLVLARIPGKRRSSIPAWSTRARWRRPRATSLRCGRRTCPISRCSSAG